MVAATCLLGCASRGFSTAVNTAGAAPPLSAVARGEQVATPPHYHPTSWFPLAPEQATLRTRVPQEVPEVLPTPPPVTVPSTTAPSATPPQPAPPVTEGRHNGASTAAADGGEAPNVAPLIEFDPE